jgi:hypothetical protein
MGRPLGSRNKYSGKDRFPTCFEIDPQTGCWNWTKSRGSHGYGDLRRDGHKLAHRWAYATFIGSIPEDAWVLHRCDNKACGSIARSIALRFRRCGFNFFGCRKTHANNPQWHKALI